MRTGDCRSARTVSLNCRSAGLLIGIQNTNKVVTEPATPLDDAHQAGLLLPKSRTLNAGDVRSVGHSCRGPNSIGRNETSLVKSVSVVDNRAIDDPGHCLVDRL